MTANDEVATIEAGGMGLADAIGSAWSRRTLVGFLVWRDLRVRYRQSFVGVAWALLQPLSFALVFAVFLGRFAGISGGSNDYWLVALSGMTVFGYFSQAVVGAANSLVDNVPLVSKVYFPRLLLPIASASSALLDAMLASAILVIAAALAGAAAWTAPIAILMPVLTLIVALGFGFWLAALNVRYRDVRVVAPFLMQLWLFVTPVAYPISAVPDELQIVYALNPMVGVVELERYLVLGTGQLELVAPGLLVCVLSLVAGIRFFLRAAHWFADVI